MSNTALIKRAKQALRVTAPVYDAEISELLDSALLDLGVAGVVVPETMTAIVETAAVTYVKLHFGSPADYDRLKASYDEQKAQLSTCTGYTVWSDDDV